MPEMDGFSTTRLIRASETTSSHRIPIVAMTAGTLTSDREDCFAAGMDDYLTKPVRTSDLQAALHRHFPASCTLAQAR
jgi:CheY-like chemotaxis protein